MSNELATMCSYNGVKLPVIPEDERVPNVCIAKLSDDSDRYYAFYSGTPIVMTSETSLILGGNNYPYGVSGSILLTDGAWPDLDVNSSPSGLPQYHRGLVWANHDIKDEDGTLYLAASEPIPIFQIEPMSFYKGVYIGQMIASTRLRFVAKEPYTWETIYENKVTYEETKAGNPTRYFAEIWSDDEPPAVMFYEGETIRLTADGVSRIYTVKLDEYGCAYFGNRTLSFDAIDGESDNGDNFCFTVLVESYGFEYISFARNPGTYQIKIERVKKPVAYLYNGVRLPKLPDEVKDYPYAYIAEMDGYYYLYLMDFVPVVKKNVLLISLYGTGNYKYHTGYTAEGWKFSGDGSASDGFFSALIFDNPRFWANFDLCWDTGAVYLAASEPVPVYE